MKRCRFQQSQVEIHRTFGIGNWASKVESIEKLEIATMSISKLAVFLAFIVVVANANVLLKFKVCDRARAPVDCLVSFGRASLFLLCCPPLYSVLPPPPSVQLRLYLSLGFKFICSVHSCPILRSCALHILLPALPPLCSAASLYSTAPLFCHHGAIYTIVIFAINTVTLLLTALWLCSFIEQKIAEFEIQ